MRFFIKRNTKDLETFIFLNATQIDKHMPKLYHIYLCHWKWSYDHIFWLKIVFLFTLKCFFPLCCLILIVSKKDSGKYLSKKPFPFIVKYLNDNHSNYHSTWIVQNESKINFIVSIENVLICNGKWFSNYYQFRRGRKILWNNIRSSIIAVDRKSWYWNPQATGYTKQIFKVIH